MQFDPYEGAVTNGQLVHWLDVVRTHVSISPQHARTVSTSVSEAESCGQRWGLGDEHNTELLRSRSTV